MPRLSVLMPVRDGEEFLSLALRSTLAALPRDAELLVIDDGSTDGTPGMLARAAESDPRVRIRTRMTDHGVAAALQDALRSTDSEFVARMDADDVCLPWRFRRQQHAVEQTDLLFGSMLLITGTGRPIGPSSAWPVRPQASGLHLTIGNFFAHPTLIARRSALVAAGGYRAGVVEDFDLWLRCAANGARITLDPVPVLAYRRHAAQVTRTWDLPADDPQLDDAFTALLPDSLRSDTAVLRRSAISRSRRDGEERAAWARLVSWLHGAGRALPTLDRSVLERRIRRWAPTAADRGISAPG